MVSTWTARPCSESERGNGQSRLPAHHGHRRLDAHAPFGPPRLDVLAAGSDAHLQDVAERLRGERPKIATVSHQTVGMRLQLLKEAPVPLIGQAFGQARYAVDPGYRDASVQTGDEVGVNEGRRPFRSRRGQTLLEVEPGEPPLPDRRGEELQHSVRYR